MHTRKTGLLDKENKRQSQSDYLKKYSIENEKNNSNQLLYEKYSDISDIGMLLVKFMFSKKATKIKIFTVHLTLCSKCQIDGEDFVNFCGLLRKHELYEKKLRSMNFDQ